MAASLRPESPAAHELRWSVRLLGAIEASGPGLRVAHWPSRAVAALLARLALAPDRAHPREELVELLWPGVDLDVGRNRLRQVLSTLKSLLEPPGLPHAPVLDADRLAIRVLPGALDCDVRQFELALRAGHAQHARALLRGELMPGFYDDWIVEERQRLLALADRVGASDDAAAPRAPAGAVPGPADGGPAPAPSRLPSYWTRTFGAERAAAQLRARVGAQRLVTVHGPGGSGKTRLASAVAQSLRTDTAAVHTTTVHAAATAIGAPDPAAPAARAEPDGDAPLHGARFERIEFVALADCADAPQMQDALCGALRVDSTGAPVARLAEALAGHRTLLVLDNFEQLVDAAGALVAQLLAAAPRLHVLVTSRRLLEVDGEVAFELEGLALPAPDAAPDAAAQSPAVGLFVDRATAARSSFRFGPRNAAAVVSLVRLLGGMPLAIELAASRVRSFAPAELLAHLREDAGTPMLDLLARSHARASASTRHASMRHVIEWSWRQLSAPQAALLRAMATLADAASAAAVAAAAGLPAGHAQALLVTLRDASLVHASAPDHGSTRYALLQPVREFAVERTDAAEARAARQRMRHWLIGFARAAMPRGPAAIAPELAHIHAALVGAPADDAGADALELALALRAYWDSDDLPLLPLLALEQALDRADGPAQRADALELLACARAAAGFATEALAHAEALLAQPLDERRRALALARWVRCVYGSGRFDPGLHAALAEALALARRCGDLEAQATVLRVQGILASNLQLDFATAEVLIAQAQRLWEQLGNRPMATVCLLSRATMWAWLGRNEQALDVLLECERVCRDHGDWTGAVVAARQTGRVHLRLRQWPPAADAFQRSARLCWQRHYTQGLVHALLHLPEALVGTGQAATAALLQGHAEARWLRLYGPLNRIEARELVRCRRRLRQQLGAARAAALHAEGIGLDAADAVALALGATPPP